VKAFSDRRFCSDLFGFIQHHQLLKQNSRLLLAVSGGLDSIVMLDFFRRFGLKKYALEWGVAHLDHALRPESAADADWLRAFCLERQIPYWSQRLDIAQEHALSPQSSLEAVARELRYAWLFEVAADQGFHSLATAHSASDQAEGVIMRLVRGSVAGLGGILPQQTRSGLRLIRPLLTLPRSEIEAYATFHQLNWREDLSNQDPAFFRNRVRKQILPLLRQENPSLEHQWAEHALYWQADQAWLDQLTQEAAVKCLTISAKKVHIDLNLFCKQPEALQRRLVKSALTQLLGDWRVFTSRHIEALCKLAYADSGKYLELPRAVNARKQGKNLILESQEKANPEAQNSSN
jgi:tRNA(Ile)-lysidine synthetase-like protein